MKLTNYEIYQIANSSNNLFDNDTYIPVKANFYIQKNLALIVAAAQEIEAARLKIAQHYGDFNVETQQYIIPKEQVEEANQELNDLFNITQDLPIKQFSLEDLEGLKFTSNQMQILMIMIAED